MIHIFHNTVCLQQHTHSHVLLPLISVFAFIREQAFHNSGYYTIMDTSFGFQMNYDGSIISADNLHTKVRERR